MRIPEKPPTEQELHNELSHGFRNFNGDPRALADIVNTEYMHWDELIIDDRFKKIERKQLWALVRFLRQFNARPIKYGDMILEYCQTPKIEQTLHDLDFRAGGKYEDEPASEALQKKYLTNSLMEEAIASSQLEGAATSRAIAKQMLRENRKPRTQSEKMIVNNYSTMNYIRENTKQDEILTPDIIKQLHKLITKGTLENEEYEGAFRTDNEVKVYARDDPVIPIFEPPDHKKIETLIADVCFFANTEPKEYYLHPIIKAIVLHFMIGYVHAFNDGNGRTARALFYWYLLSRKYDHFEYISVSRVIKDAPGQYARAYLFTETDNNDITYFVKFNLNALDKALRLFEDYIRKTKQENKKIAETIRKNPNINLRQADILITINKNARPITIKEMQERYRITYETARTDLLELVKQGYLNTNTRGKQFVFIPDKEKCMSG